MKHSRLKFITALLTVVTVTLIAFALRIQAVDRLPIDYDEDDYLSAAQFYASALSAGDLGGLINYDYNFEHPPLAKLIYGVAIMALPQAEPVPALAPDAPIARSLPQPHFTVARLVSACLGTIQVMVLALVSPLAALFLAIDTWQIKYTSQIMLEALPSLTSILCVIFYTRSGRRWNLWQVFSAVMLGLTVASKYPYAIVGVVIIVDWVSVMVGELNAKRGKISYLRLLGGPFVWGLLAIVIFFAANPRLWSNPLQRLVETFVYHRGYALGEQVEQAGLPPWSPITVLFQSVPWHPGVFTVSIDVIFPLLAVAGYKSLWRKKRIYALWLVFALSFLLVWPTKWPQYTLILTVPLTMAAAQGFRELIVEPLRNFWNTRYSWRSKFAFKPGAIFNRANGRAVTWLLPGGLVLGIIVLYPMLFQGAMAVTDFSSRAIRDGLNGGVWREAWRGLTGQADPVEVDFFDSPTSREVHYAGGRLFFSLLGGAGADLVVFGIIWTLLSLAAQIGLGVAAAMLLNRAGVLLKGWWRAVFILPWAIPEFVGALIWSQIFDPRFGWLQMAAKTWYERPDYPGATLVAGWQENPMAALAVLLVAAAWYGFPFMFFAAAAGLRMIPGEVYEAAAMDGAGGWKLFWQITWPLLAPLLVPAILIRSIFAFNQFYIFYVLQPPYPLATFASISFYFFDGAGQYAVSAALNLFTVLVLIVLISWFNRWSRASEGVTYA